MNDSEMLTRCAERGMVPHRGIQIAPSSAGGVGQFLVKPSLDRLRTMTRDPFPYLGGATKAQQARWSEEEREHADIYTLIQRDFSGKKRKNVDQLVAYLREVLEGRTIGFLPPPILWYQMEDIEVSDTFLAARQGAYPHAIDGSTRIAAVHRLHRDHPPLRQKMTELLVPVVIVYGDTVDEDVAAQIFSDVNFKAIPVDPSVAKAMDQRDLHTKLADDVQRAIAALVGRVSRRRQLTASDTALFTRYALYQALRCFTDGAQALDKMFESKTLLPGREGAVTATALDFWRDLENIFGEQWSEQGGREKYLHMQAPVLKAISCVAHDAYFPAVDPVRRGQLLADLRGIDWDRSHGGWLGLATRAGKERPLIINNDAAVRDLARAFEQRDSRLPRVRAAA